MLLHMDGNPTNQDLEPEGYNPSFLSNVFILFSSPVLVSQRRICPVCIPRKAILGVEMENRGGSAGVGFWGFGSMLAIAISWSVNHSILWMILHGILSWLYVIYYSIKR
jgi:hypothetical protein